VNVLGFAFWDGAHNGAAALVCDGQLVAAAEEERFSRQKHDGDIPLRAIEYCLRQGGLEMSRIDAIAFPHRPYRSGPDSQIAEMDWYEARALYRRRELRTRALLHKAAIDVAVRAHVAPNVGLETVIAQGLDRVRRHFGSLPPVKYYGHHEAHAAAAFLTTGFERAAVLTMDGRGGPHATVAWEGRGHSVKSLATEPYTNSLGYYYFDITRYIGLGEFGEGKTMGLASYGDPSRFAGEFGELLDSTAGRWYEYKRKPGPDLFGFGPRRDQPITGAPYPEFAAAAQAALEHAVQRTVRWLLKGRSEPLCLSGGVALNCSSNGKLRALFPDVPISVFPAAGDAGLGIGAALLLAAEHGEYRRTAIDHAYWGPEFTPAECEAALRAAKGIRFTRPTDVIEDVAERLASGDIVGWFQGRMEIGPRALGNRSILADPRTVVMRDRVNRVKSRELWRPLAPAVLAERASEFFDMKGESPFMLFAVPVRKEKAAVIPAVVHVDGSARPQTVTAAQNPRMHALISAFARRTGVPIVMNTSFNGAGEPVVCAPADAIKTFLASGMNVLALGDYVVTRADSPA
jgi:carbamoyltransferase